MRRLAFAALLLIMLCPVAGAQCVQGRCGVTYSPAPSVAYYQQTVVVVSADAYGFTAWLNSQRAAYGLPAVAYDQVLAAWAQENNARQCSRGLGHFVFGPARRQNSGMGSFAMCCAGWLGSPAHRAALLDPTIRWVGIAGMGAYWTFNAR